jgi:hypothetical protein
MKPQASDIRSLVAGARLAFDDDPAGYFKKDQGKSPQDRILEQAMAIIGDAPRIRSDEGAVSPEDDRAAGRALFADLARSAVA